MRAFPKFTFLLFDSSFSLCGVTTQRVGVAVVMEEK